LIHVSAVSFMFRYGGADTDEGYAGMNTSDGGFLAGGIWGSYGANGDFGIVKYDRLGVLVFGKSLGTSAEDRAYGLVETSSGYVLAGRTLSSSGNGGYDGLVVMLNVSGNFQWAKFVGTNLNDYPYWVVEDNDGNILAAGYSVSFGNGIWLFKMDNSGNLLWSRSYEYGDASIAREVRVDANGKYILAGRVGSGSNYDGLVLRVDNSGTPLWSLRMDLGGEERIFSVSQTPSGEICAAGYTNVDGDYDILVLRMDTLGNVLWVRKVGGSSDDQAFGVAASSDDGCVVVGYTFSYSHDFLGFEDAIIFKLDASGNLVWARIFWGENFGDVGNSVHRASDDGFLVVGNSYKLVGFSTVSDWFIVKFLADGTVCSDQYASISPTITTPSYTTDNTLPTFNDRTSSTGLIDVSLTVQTLPQDTVIFCTPLGQNDELDVEERGTCASSGRILEVFTTDGRRYRSIDEAPRGVLLLRTERGWRMYLKR